MVEVYSLPGWPGGTANDLEDYEEGRTGKYYY
jgi:hypothetical protein